MTETALRLSRGLFRILIALPLVAPGRDRTEPSAERRALAGLEIAIRPNGAVPDAGWALARLNDGGCMTSASFAYPETSTPVRLYLIDSGVAHADTWFAQNPNLKSFRSELVRAFGDPEENSAVSHGSQILSLIAGPETGAALGTPLHVVNYNIYPDGEGTSTTSGRMAEAIDRAIGDHASHPAMRSVMCIANGSSFPGAESYILEELIAEAVDAGITVVVSAGNEGADATQYIPAAYGTMDGVICTGASDANNVKLPSSNAGNAVDLYAPGFEVRTMNVASPGSGSFGTATGTSPATALTAAAALIQLSLDPTLSPAAVEQALTATASPAVGPQQAELLVQVQPDPEGDSDLDGTSDILERFFGSNPADPVSIAPPMAVSRVSGQARLSFRIASELFEPAQPHVLADGSTWKLRVSTNLKDWQDASGTLTPGPAVGGVIPVVFSVPSPGPSCFLRIEVTPAP